MDLSKNSQVHFCRENCAIVSTNADCKTIRMLISKQTIHQHEKLMANFSAACHTLFNSQFHIGQQSTWVLGNKFRDKSCRSHFKFHAVKTQKECAMR
ncbi:Protein translocase subunit SecA [Trichinella spiralis]|uniref:Protein translocase subunit SecA n=1 Tax=Trichinella spiralis TaxID=6334 RepID=A0ABR3KE15_TRISP